MNSYSKELQAYKRAHYDQINVFSEKGLKDIAKYRARQLGLSLSQYVTKVIEDEIRDHTLVSLPDDYVPSYAKKMPEQINVLTPKGMRARSKARASELNRSLSRYIRDLIKDDALRNGMFLEYSDIVEYSLW